MEDVFDHQQQGSGCGCGCSSHDTVTVFPEDMPDWESLPDSEIVCHCANVSKEAVVKAIKMGATTLPLVKVMTNVARGKDCAQNNPLGRSCELDVLKLIDIYSGT